MSNEMDLRRMDERQRLAWLMANRGTVLAIGATWIGMIVHELARGGTPVFLIATVPLFGALLAASAALSGLIVLWVPALLFELDVLLVWLLPVPARPEAGCYVAIAANGVWVLLWLAEALRVQGVEPPPLHGGRRGR